jgi:hypothetical protein
MHTSVKIILGAVSLSVIALSWGYWHSQTYAYLNLRVDDYGLKSENSLYGEPHGVTLKLLGAAGEELAVARSVEPDGYIVPIHPSPEIGNCRHRVNSNYSSCFNDHSAWVSK